MKECMIIIWKGKINRTFIWDGVYLSKKEMEFVINWILEFEKSQSDLKWAINRTLKNLQVRMVYLLLPPPPIFIAISPPTLSAQAARILSQSFQQFFR